MTTATPSPSTDDAPHLEGFVVEPEPDAADSATGETADPSDPAAGAADAAGDDAETLEIDPADLGPDGLFNYPAFHRAWCTLHELPGEATGLRTLMEAPDSDPGKRASRAIYNTIRETPSLRWMLKPGGKWVYRIFVVGSYGWALKTACAVEIAARRSAATAEAPDAAGDEENLKRS